MARRSTYGTPTRSEHYLRPRPALRLTLVALLATAGVSALFLAAELLGLRAPLSPGRVSARHATWDASCRECHVALRGVPNLRCQRCHDPGVGGRLDHPAHVLFGSLDEKKAAAAPALECASCHVEHRAGRALTRVPESDCVRCHDDPAQVAARIPRFARHPEFGVLAAGRRQSTGLVYSHLTHVTLGKGKKAGYLVLDKERRAQGVDSPGKTCFECHQRQPQEADFRPVSFEAHCLACHRGELKMDPVAAEVLLAPDAVPALQESGDVRPEEFDTQGGQLLKLRVVHEDPWIQLNLRKLQSELDPVAFAAARAALRANRAGLERRLILAQPPAARDAPALRLQIESTRQELAVIEGRLAAPAQAPGGGGRVTELAGALQGSGDPEAQALGAELARRTFDASAPAGGLGEDDFGQRRAEILRLLDAVEKADPRRKPQADELRRRLAALKPGQSSREVLERARAQRRATLERLEDELQLRLTGTAPPPETLLRGEVEALRRGLRELDAKLAFFDLVPPAGPLTADERRGREEAVQALSKGCRYCHVIGPAGAFPEVRAAEPVLRRATFTHRAHLTRGEACASCHSAPAGSKPAWSIETSGFSEDLSFRGVESCRACHGGGGAGQACLECHRYHPKGDRP